MKALFRITLLAMATLFAFTACEESEEEITPSGDYSPIRGGFPQGDSEYDKILLDIKNQYGVYLLYKDVSEEDMNRTWVSAGTGAIYVAGKDDEREKGAWDLPDAHLKEYVDFFQNYIFDNITEEFAKSTFPVKIYMINNLRTEPRVIEDDDQEGENVQQGTDTNPNKVIKLGDFDNWAISIPDSVIGNKNSAYALKQISCIFMTNVIKNSMNKGELVAPNEFWADYSMNRDADCINGSKHDGCDKVDINDKESANGLYTLGYIDVLESKFGTGRTPEIIKKITHERGWLHPDYWTAKVNPTCDLFEAYIMNAMWFTPEEFDERYNTGENTLIREKYDFVVKYMNEQYGINLQGIATASLK